MLLPPRSPGPMSPVWARKEDEWVVNALLQRGWLLAMAKNRKSPPKLWGHTVRSAAGLLQMGQVSWKDLGVTQGMP